MRKVANKASFVLTWMVVFLLYFSSELVLRVYFVYGEGKSKEQLKALTKKLPNFLAEPLQAKQQRDSARSELDKAILGTNSDKIIEAYYSYAANLEGEEQNKIYREMLDKYPEKFECSRAYTSLLSEKGSHDLKALLTYKDKFNKSQQIAIMNNAWAKISKFAPQQQRLFIKELLTRQYTHANLFSTYKQLMSVAFKLKLDMTERSQIEDLRDKSFELLQKESKNNRSKGRKRKN